MAKFKVGDIVKFDKDTKGKIIKIKPSLLETGVGLGRNRTYDYLVESKFVFEDGNDIVFSIGMDENNLKPSNSYVIRQRLGIK